MTAGEPFELSDQLARQSLMVSKICCFVTIGSGLGLYIAKGPIEAHGGRIWADSVPGETTTFHFTLPLDRPLVAIAASASQNAAHHSWN